MGREGKLTGQQCPNSLPMDKDSATRESPSMDEVSTLTEVRSTVLGKCTMTWQFTQDAVCMTHRSVLDVSATLIHLYVKSCWEGNRQVHGVGT